MIAAQTACEHVLQVGKFAFVANSRARSVDDTEGLVKFISDKKSDKILGAHIMGPNAGISCALFAPLSSLLYHGALTWHMWGWRTQRSGLLNISGLSVLNLNNSSFIV